MQRQLELTKAALKRKRATRPRGQRIPESEAQVQHAIIERLTLAGYTVVSTSRIRKGVRCQCGRFNVPSGGDGVTKGCPDLFITHVNWPPSMWVAIEVKGSHTPVSDEQRAMIANERYFVARDQDTADRLLREAETAILGKTHGRTLAGS